MTAPLVLLLGASAFAPPSEAAQPAPRQGAKTQAAKRTPPPRRQLSLSPQVRQRLNRATAPRKPKTYSPLSKQEVRSSAPSSKRPARTTSKGKAKRLGNAELTKELNAIERKLNSQGYSLRDKQTVLYHEHRPDRAKLQAQTRKVRVVADTKPKRAPLTSDQLRSKVRSSTRPPKRRAPVRGGDVPGFWLGSDAPAAAVDFGWTPSVGEAEVGSAYLDTRVSFTSSLGGLEPGLHGSMMVKAGGYILGARVDVARFEARVDSSLDGQHSATGVVTLPGGYEYALYDKQGSESVSVTKDLDLYDSDQEFGWVVLIAGYPVSIDLTLSPSLKLKLEAAANDGYVYESFAPQIEVDVTLEAYIDMLLAEVGAGGSTTLISASPTLAGGAYFGGSESQPSAHAMLTGSVDFEFLKGRVYAFLELGWWIFTTRFEWELWDYDGWKYQHPLFQWDNSNAS